MHPLSLIGCSILAVNSGNEKKNSDRAAPAGPVLILIFTVRSKNVYIFTLKPRPAYGQPAVSLL
jgi:hypothetical protein